MNGKRYKLSILPLFEDDLNEIVDYITYRLHNPIAAENLIDEVEKAIDERLDCAEAFEPYHSTGNESISITVSRSGTSPFSM